MGETEGVSASDAAELMAQAGEAEPLQLEHANDPLDAVDSLGAVDTPEFSLRSVAKYLNPVVAARAYGRFVGRTVKNFGLAEVNSTLSVLASGYLANRFAGDAVDGWVTAVATAVGENAGFYGTTATKKYRALRRNYSLTPRQAIRETARHHKGVFPLAEVVDQPVRPFSMWLGLKLAGGLPGLIGGKLFADHVTYGIIDHRGRAYDKKAEPRLAGYSTEHGDDAADSGVSTATNEAPGQT